MKTYSSRTVVWISALGFLAGVGSGALLVESFLAAQPLEVLEEKPDAAYLSGTSGISMQVPEHDSGPDRLTQYMAATDAWNAGTALPEGYSVLGFESTDLLRTGIVNRSTGEHHVVFRVEDATENLDSATASVCGRVVATASMGNGFVRRVNAGRSIAFLSFWVPDAKHGRVQLKVTWRGRATSGADNSWSSEREWFSAIDLAIHRVKRTVTMIHSALARSISSFP